MFVFISFNLFEKRETMKYLKITNTIALLIPIIFSLLGFVNNDNFVYAIMSTAATGIIQVMLGLILFYLNPKEIKIWIYLLLTSLFFVIWLVFGFSDWIWGFPPILCLYLSILIYSKK